MARPGLERTIFALRGDGVAPWRTLPPRAPIDPFPGAEGETPFGACLRSRAGRLGLRAKPSPTLSETGSGRVAAPAFHGPPPAGAEEHLPEEAALTGRSAASLRRARGPGAAAQAARILPA